MRRGFIFDSGKCVDCKACSAGCILENGWGFKPRSVFRSISWSGKSLAVLNLSMACNHCEKPACLEGCPSGAYRKDREYGAVLLDDTRCIGCRYCMWKCPFDAPKPDPGTGLIGKCNLCITALEQGIHPACASACPTGALNYGDIEESSSFQYPAWLPGRNLDPGLIFRETGIGKKLTILPEDKLPAATVQENTAEKSLSGEWSLISFTFLVTLSVGILVSSLMDAKLPNRFLLLSLILASGFVSLFHLGNKLRAWRAATNIIHSPLSREIVFWLVYAVLAAVALIAENYWLMIAASLSGIILLLLIDSVYDLKDRGTDLFISSGQTFITGLILASFFAGLKYPFLFIAAIKVILSVRHLFAGNRKLKLPVLRFFRIAILIIAGISITSGISFADPAITFIFVAGELIDRIIFYIDFEPVSLASVISAKT